MTIAEEMLLRELVSLLRENNRLLQDISGKLNNLTQPTWEPPPAYINGKDKITEKEQVGLNEIQNFVDQLKNNPEMFESSLPEGLLVRTDVWALFDEIKAYTNEHPGEIRPADLPANLMLGFIHDDGTYWSIRIADVKQSFHKDYHKDSIDTSNMTEDERLNLDKSKILSRALITLVGKQSLCAVLSNKK